MFEPNMALKMHQDGPKTAPRAAKSGPRATQSGQDRPKTAPRPPKIAQDRPKIAQDRPKTDPGPLSVSLCFSIRELKTRISLAPLFSAEFPYFPLKGPF